MRLLYLSNKAKTAEDARAARATFDACSTFLKANGSTVQLIFCLDDFNARMDIVKHWPGWIKSVSTGMLSGNEPLYHGYVIDTQFVGMANKQIIQNAIDMSKPCWLWYGGAFSVIKRVGPGHPTARLMLDGE